MGVQATRGGRRLGRLRGMTDQETTPRVPGAVEQVGLALRAFRRSRGWSQRALAAELGMAQSVLARMERRAGEAPLQLVLDVLREAGFALVLVDDRGQVVTDWEPTDLVAADRAGRRFPAHREVRTSKHGPRWWLFHEYFGTGKCGPQPGWTAEGFTPPEGTRFGRVPRPAQEGEGPRWPY